MSKKLDIYVQKVKNIRIKEEDKSIRNKGDMIEIHEAGRMACKAQLVRLAFIVKKSFSS